MATASNPRTIRIFLSSTFRDFAEERDLLVRKVFPELRRKCRERQVELVDVDLRWGITEKEAQQGKVLPICLAEVDRSRPWFMGFIGERYGWVPAPEQFDPAIVQEQPWLEEHRGGKSVTELEILHGVLNNPKMAGRAFFYFRDSKWSKKKGGAYLSEGREEKTKLEVLKDRIRKSGFPVLENYPSPEALAERVKEDLWKLIDEAYPESEVPDALTRERMTHEAYAATRRRLYLGGEAYFKALDEAMKVKPFRPVLITGQSGGGKSALLANWVKRWSPKHPKTTVIVHHLGCGADAADPVRLVVRLMREISRLTGDEFKPESDPDKQLEQLPQWLALASAWAQRSKKELLIVLDGLDKVADRKHLRWFPAFLPPKLKLVASCLHGEILEAAKGRLEWQELKVEPFTKIEQKSFIGEYLGRYRKALTAKQMKTLQSHALSGNPLFLLTVLEELRVFGVHEELEQRLKTLLSPPTSKAKGEAPTVDDVFEYVLARVETDLGKKSVQSVMEALWASRSGLFQDELLAIAKLAPARWAQIQNALDESLYESSGRINFGHDYLRKAVEDRYRLTGKRKLSLHRRLAEWFAEREVDERVAAELPWQWRQAEKTEALTRCMIEREIFEECYAKDEYELLGYWLWTGKDFEAEYERAFRGWHRSLSGEERVTITSSLAAFLQTSGRYGQFTEKLYRHALKSEEKAFGTDYPDTLASVSNLGNLLSDKGDYAGAEALYRRTLEGRERTLGAEHPDTLASANNLGNLLYSKGDYDEAEALCRRALKGYERVLGGGHLSALASVNNLGNLLYSKGDYAGAEALYRRTLEGRERALGAEHPDTLASANNLGNLLYSKGDYAGAEALCRRAFKGYVKVLGEEHPDTLTTLNNLGNLLSDKGDREGAEIFYRRAFECRERVLGKEHPDTLGSMNNLALLLSDKGDYKEAELLCLRTLKGKEKALGPAHPDTLLSVNNLATVLANRGDYKGAEALYRRALKGRNIVVGPRHPDTLQTVNNLAIALRHQGKITEACKLHKLALHGFEAIYDKRNYTLLSCAGDLAVAYAVAGMNQNSNELIRKHSAASKISSCQLFYAKACISCIRGDFETAKSLIQQHLEKAPENRSQALQDPDLRKLWKFIANLD